MSHHPCDIDMGEGDEPLTLDEAAVANLAAFLSEEAPSHGRAEEWDRFCVAIAYTIVQTAKLTASVLDDEEEE